MIGEVFTTNTSGDCRVVDYVDSKHVTVEFSSGFVTTVSAHVVRIGAVKDPLYPTIHGVGYIGIGRFGSKSHFYLYTLWKDMLLRGHSIAYKEKHPTYAECSVAKRWHDFQRFCGDITRMNNWETDGFSLDKDLRVFGNKKYGPKTCSFVPNEINTLLTNDGEGVYADGHMHVARIRLCGKQYLIGRFEDRRVAVREYKLVKTEYVHRMADAYKADLHPDVYHNLCRFAA
ncbi:putative HNH endonuclease protein [Rhizobium phage RHph_N28_1]|nr:putative HNH endonuclease protein [Rhizobium phage RHph_N28_1]QIG74285.1 putative HNH endonuclease protein [Rhizobium phage RHph_N42]